ncbi:unnamed protein product [Dracunculus medinensis]|uniref:Uncharacterized protein n=1 Tax=Dracunculus medinensis TaxID=318479 RepID=A0A3P7Q0N5_DRAME|nr:unnamed protein product [Dracunculus medinensis]
MVVVRHQNLRVLMQKSMSKSSKMFELDFCCRNSAEYSEMCRVEGVFVLDLCIVTKQSWAIFKKVSE